MATTLNSSGVTFPDGTTQTSAYSGIPTPVAGTVVPGMYMSAWMYSGSWQSISNNYTASNTNGALAHGVAAVTTTYAKAARAINISSGKAYQKIKVLKDGTFKCYVGLSTGYLYNGCTASYSYANAYARIYKNGVAVGTERSVAGGPTGFGNWTEDLTFATGDVIELYVRSSTSSMQLFSYLQLGVSSEAQLESYAVLGA